MNTMEEQDWEGRTTGGGQENETTRKFGKITFMQRGEDDPADIEQVRMELVKELSRGKSRDSEDWEEGGEFDLSEGLLGEGGFGNGDWERFLPQRRLRVLLVEDDDSTRHVVGALLRNCNYEVCAASNGMQAWELLEDETREFDLILTDVVMPGLSGIGLLSRVMARESHKTLPVIMMSSHDSMDLVMRCFQKGAADFLVKPVRKNELKNLWQHVWRKCHSSSGSGSGSQTDANIASNCQEGSGHGSDDGGRESARGSGNSLNTQARGSDNGSGTQIEPSALLARDKFKERSKIKSEATNSLDHSLQGRRNENSTVRVHSNTEDKPNEKPAASIPDNEMEEDRLAAEKKKKLKTAPYSNEERREEISLGTSSTPEPNSTPEQEFSSPAVKTMNLLGGLYTPNPSGLNPVKPADDHVRTNVEETQAMDEKMEADGEEEEEEDKDMDRGGSNSPQEEDSEENAQGGSGKEKEEGDVAMFDLTLKRPRDAEETEEEKEEKRILTQSGSSAFSRYSTVAQASLSNQQQSQNNNVNNANISSSNNNISNISPSYPPIFTPSHASMISRIPVKHDHSVSSQEGSSIPHTHPHPHPSFHLAQQSQHAFSSQNANQANQNATDLNAAVSSNLPHGMFIGGMSQHFSLLPSLQPAAMMSFDQIQNSYRASSSFIHPAYFGPSSNHCWPTPCHLAEGDRRMYADANSAVSLLQAQQSPHAQPQAWRTHHPHPSHPSLQSENNTGKKVSHPSENKEGAMESYGSLHGSNNVGNSSNVLSSVVNRNSNENDSNGNGSNGNGSHGVVSIRKDSNANDGDVNKDDENLENGANGSDGNNSNGNGSQGNGNGSIVDMPSNSVSVLPKDEGESEGNHVTNNSNKAESLAFNAGNVDLREPDDGNAVEKKNETNSAGDGNVSLRSSGFPHNVNPNPTNSTNIMNEDTATVANWHLRREAALNKFRQKRKERCFEKKVRYQSRKKLAEQRPRVKGQFVRQDALNTMQQR